MVWMLEFLKGTKIQYGANLFSGTLPAAWQGQAIECNILPIGLGAVGPGVGAECAVWVLYPEIRSQTHHHSYHGLLLSSLLNRLWLRAS